MKLLVYHTKVCRGCRCCQKRTHMRQQWAYYTHRCIHTFTCNTVVAVWFWLHTEVHVHPHRLWQSTKYVDPSATPRWKGSVCVFADCVIVFILFGCRLRRSWNQSVVTFWMHWRDTYSPLLSWESLRSSTTKCKSSGLNRWTLFSPCTEWQNDN